MKSARFALLFAGLLLVAGCNTPAHHDHADHAMSLPTKAMAVMHPTAGNQTAGVIRFEQFGQQVKVTAEITGLTPGQQHAFHIHEFGDCSALDATSAGGHYNPEGHDHGLPSTHLRHAGDLGNLTADANGKATYEIVVDNITIAGPHNPILGRGVIIHAKPDDGGQPVGNAGARIACGVIGVAK